MIIKKYCPPVDLNRAFTRRMHCISETRPRILPGSFIPALKYIRRRDHKAPLVVYKAIISASARKQMKTKGKRIRMGIAICLPAGVVVVAQLDPGA